MRHPRARALAPLLLPVALTLGCPEPPPLTTPSPTHTASQPVDSTPTRTATATATDQAPSLTPTARPQTPTGVPPTAPPTVPPWSHTPSPTLAPTPGETSTDTPAAPSVTQGTPGPTASGTTATPTVSASPTGSGGTISPTPTGTFGTVTGSPTTPTEGATVAETDPPTGSLTPSATLPPTQPPITEAPTPLQRDVAAWQIVSPRDLMQGIYAYGDVGDVMMANDQLRIIVQKPRRDIGWGLFGGTIVDAALVDGGRVGIDLFGELSPFVNVALGANVDAVTIEDDGTGGQARVVAEGHADLFDILKLDAATATVGLTIPYDVNQVLPIRIRTTYTLGAASRQVHVETELFNEGTTTISLPVGDLNLGAGDVEVFTPNPTGRTYTATLDGETTTYSWGGFEEAPFAIPEFLGFFGAGGAFGYLPPLTSGGDPDFMSLAISGVTVTVVGTTSLLDVFLKVDRNLLQIPAGKSASYERDLFFGEDIAAVSDQIYAHNGVQTGLLTGKVQDGEGRPLSNVRVGVVAGTNLNAAVTAMYTGEDGAFSARLPAGDYGLLAAQGFDFVEVGRPGILTTPVAAKVKKGATTTQNLTLGEPGEVSIRIVDGDDGHALPAKVLLYGPYTPPPKVVMDVSLDRLPSGAARIRWLEQGEGTFQMPPGTYDVVVSRGFEYDVAEIADVVVTEGETVTVDATLTRVLDTRGWLSSDVHVHGMGSPDSSTLPEDRVRTFSSEGVDVLVSTDHDWLQDFGPAIRALGMEDEITSLVGVESTTFSMGHFNVFPLEQDLSAPGFGALDHADADHRPLDLETGEPVDLGIPAGLPSGQDGLAAWQMMKAWELSQPGEQVRQVNHARGDLGGNFTVIGLDLSKDGTDEVTSADPESFRIAPGTPLFDASWISAMEIANNPSVSRVLEGMNDWFGLLNLGYSITGTGVSDTHNRVASESGYARTYVRVPHEDPRSASEDPDFGETFARAMNDQRAIIASGIFLDAEIEGQGGQRVGLGETVTAEDGLATLHLRAQAPSWAGIEKISIFVSPVVYANAGDVTIPTSADLDPEVVLTPGAGLTVVKVHAGGDSTRPFRWEAVAEIDLALAGDAWVVVMAEGKGGQLRPAVDSGQAPVAVTNPIYVDADGEPGWTPPGHAFVLPQAEAPQRLRGAARHAACAHGPDPIEVWREVMRAQARAAGMTLPR